MSNQENLVTRRSFVKFGSLAVATSAFGLSVVSVTGCTQPSTPASSDNTITVTLNDGKVSCKALSSDVSYTGGAISIVPDSANGKINLRYTDAQGASQSAALGDLGATIVITGTADMLTVDGLWDEGSLKLDEKATISVLSVGSIKSTDIAGTVGTLVCVGNTDATLEETSKVGTVVMGDSFGDVFLGNSASVREVRAPHAAQVHDAAAGTKIDLVDPTSAHEENLKFLAKAAEGASLDQPSKADNPLVPKAYADTPTDTSGAGESADDEPMFAVEPTSEEEFERMYSALPDTTRDGSEGLPESADSESALDVTELFKKALESAIESAGEGLGEFASSMILEYVFGKKDDTTELMEKLESIENDLKNIQEGISKILSEQQKAQYADQVNTFMTSYFNRYSADLEFIENMSDKIDAMADGPDKVSAQKQFAEDLMSGGDQQRYKVDGDFIYVAALKLAKQFVTPYVNQGTNLIQAYDKLLILTYKWEHQGYDTRIGFQQAVSALLVRMLGYSQFALRAHIAAIKDDPSKAKELMETIVYLENLFGTQKSLDLLRNAAEVEDDNAQETKTGAAQDTLDVLKADACITLDGSLRRYQVPGHEVLLSATAVVVHSDRNAGLYQPQLMTTSAGLHPINQDELMNIVNDYGATPLETAFFSQDEGNFAVQRDHDCSYICYANPLIKKETTFWRSTVTGYYVPCVSKEGVARNEQVSSRATHAHLPDHVFDFAGIAICKANQ